MLKLLTGKQKKKTGKQEEKWKLIYILTFMVTIQQFQWCSSV